MAKRKGAADFLAAFLAKPGATKAAAARSLNRSVSTVNRVLRGASSGDTLREGAKELARHKPPPLGGEVRLRSAPLPAPAARIAAERSAPFPVTIAPGVERQYLGGGRRETRYEHPTEAQLRADLRNVTMHQVQLRVTFNDGTTGTIWKKGGYDPIKARRALAAAEEAGEALESLLDDAGYSSDEHGGVASVSVVLL